MLIVFWTLASMVVLLAGLVFGLIRQLEQKRLEIGEKDSVLIDRQEEIDCLRRDLEKKESSFT